MSFRSIGFVSCGDMDPAALMFITSFVTEIGTPANVEQSIGTWSRGAPTKHSATRFGMVPFPSASCTVQFIGLSPFPVSADVCLTNANLTRLLFLDGIVFLRSGVGERCIPEDAWIHRLRGICPVLEVSPSLTHFKDVISWITPIISQPPPPGHQDDADDTDEVIIRLVTRCSKFYVGYVICGAHSGEPTSTWTSCPSDGTRAPRGFRIGKRKVNRFQRGQFIGVDWAWGGQNQNRKFILRSNTTSSGKKVVSYVFHKWMKIQVYIGSTDMSTCDSFIASGNVVKVSSELSSFNATVHHVTFTPEKSLCTLVVWASVVIVVRKDTAGECGIVQFEQSCHLYRCTLQPLPSLAEIPSVRTPAALMRVAFLTPQVVKSVEMQAVREHVVRRRHRFQVIDGDSPTGLCEALSADDTRKTCIVMSYANDPSSKELIDGIMSWAKRSLPDAGRARPEQFSYAFVCLEKTSQEFVPLFQKIKELRVGELQLVDSHDSQPHPLAQYITMMTGNYEGEKAVYRGGWVPLSDRDHNHGLVCKEALVVVTQFSYRAVPMLQMFLGSQLMNLNYPVVSPVPLSWSNCRDSSLMHSLDLEPDIHENNVTDLQCCFVTNGDMVSALMVLIINQPDFPHALTIPTDFMLPSSVVAAICGYAQHTPKVAGTELLNGIRHVIKPSCTMVTTFPNFTITTFPRLTTYYLHSTYNYLMSRIPSIPSRTLHSDELESWMNTNIKGGTLMIDTTKRELLYAWTGYDSDILRQPIMTLYVDEGLGIYVFDIPTSIPMRGLLPTHVNNVQAMLAHLNLPEWNFDET
eukprot:PhF_6_TR5668/c0_g1_i3/m.8344